jgi:hypothetical protein
VILPSFRKLPHNFNFSKSEVILTVRGKLRGGEERRIGESFKETNVRYYATPFFFGNRKHW